mmetsp:Transcript_34113/g.80288  ORF Transcript_34113/g.80288 Transcript_34113/m.80288 type:complete len:221 (+) Transcript_34113:349-1011(+)
MVTDDICSAPMPSKPFLSWTSHTASTRDFSNSSSVSPMHKTTFMPFSTRILHWALMSSSDSPLITRRSECPARAHSIPMLFNWTGLTPPVKAPFISAVTISAPTMSLSPTISFTVSRNGKGTKRPTSAGQSSPIESAIPRAKSTASAFVWGFSFQFPVMKALRAASSVLVGPTTEGATNCLLTKAFDVPTSDRREMAAENFIVDFGVGGRILVILELGKL